MSISPFKNSFPQSPGSNKTCAELPIRSIDTTYGSSISCNQESVYFALGSGDVGIIPLLEFGKKRYTVPLLITSSNTLVSIASTFLNSEIFSTVAQSDGLKLWKKTLSKSPFYTEFLSINPPDQTIRNVTFHPCCSQIISYSSSQGVTIVDCEKQDRIQQIGDKDYTQLSWKDDGSLISCVTETGEFSVLDPRTKANCQDLVHPLKKSHVLWAGNTNYFFGFGYNPKLNFKSVYVWDIRNLKQNIVKKDIGDSTSFSYPIYDSDTGMLLVASKGTQISYFMEFDGTKITEPRCDQYEDITQGMCFFPRTLLNVMSCEVLRVLQLGKSVISHISYEVMRKSKSSFFPELFPDAKSNTDAITPEEWFNGEIKELSKISLEPKKPKTEEINEQKSVEPEFERVIQPLKIFSDESLSKFKNIFSEAIHKKYSHDMLNNVDLKSNAESNGMSCNYDTLAVPLIGTSGKIGILQLSKPGRVPICGPFFVENKSHVSDFEIDKKNDNILGAVTDNGYVNIWKLPPLPLENNLDEPTNKFLTNGERATVVKFHPCANGIVGTAGLDGVLRVFDYEKGKSICTGEDNENFQALSFDWNESGSLLCGAYTSRVVKIFDPRSSKSSTMCSDPYLSSGNGRIVFVDDVTVFVSAFTTRGRRLLAIHDLRNFKKLRTHYPLDEAPSAMIPFYDRDNKVVYLSSPGECNILPVELRTEDPGIMLLPKYLSLEPQCAVSFLRKDVCNVRNVEVAKCVRLLQGTTEIVSFTVSRTKSEYFQDDLFPKTRKIWTSSMSADDYENKNDKLQDVLDLKPNDMQNLSEIDFSDSKGPKYNSLLELRKNVQVQQETGADFLGMVMGKAKKREDDPIIQDERQGVDESEWDD